MLLSWCGAANASGAMTMGDVPTSRRFIRWWPQITFAVMGSENDGEKFMNWIDVSLALKTLQEICSDNIENCGLCPFYKGEECYFMERSPQDWDVRKMIDEVKDWQDGR